MYSYNKSKYFTYYTETWPHTRKTNTFSRFKQTKTYKGVPYPIARNYTKNFKNRSKYSYRRSQNKFNSKFKYHKDQSGEKVDLTLNRILGRSVVNLSSNVYKFVNGRKDRKNYQQIKGTRYKNKYNSFHKNLKSFHKNSNFKGRSSYAISHRLINRSVRCLSSKPKEQYCQFFNRFGRCHKGVHCNNIHDPHRISICTRFLQGKCLTTSCLFSHKVSPDRMHVCSFFLRGLCARGNKCQYRHVKVNVAAEVCQEFLNGYCSAGVECRKKHDNTCADFSRNGSCDLGDKCVLRHVARVARKKKSAIKTCNGVVEKDGCMVNETKLLGGGKNIGSVEDSDEGNKRRTEIYTDDVKEAMSDEESKQARRRNKRHSSDLHSSFVSVNLDLTSCPSSPTHDAVRSIFPMLD